MSEKCGRCGHPTKNHVPDLDAEGVQCGALDCRSCTPRRFKDSIGQAHYTSNCLMGSLAELIARLQQIHMEAARGR